MLKWLKFRRADPFEEFRQAVAGSFAFLVSDLGFVAADATPSYRDIVIAFAHGTVRVGVGYELGSEPWVYINLATPSGRQSFGLHTVIEGHLGTRAPLDRVAAATSVASKVQILADLTREHGQHLLRGDTSTIRNLRDLRAASVRERNQQMCGTSTGESPRFAGRPTLPELFSDGTNDDIKTARTYQAIWDYGYSRAEVGEFLGITPGDVQKRLDEWELHG